MSQADDNHPAPTALVADDRGPVLRLLQTVLGREGYRVLLARGGAEALRLTGEERPSLVLLNVRMPIVSGLDVCRRIKTDAQISGIPVVLVSAHAQDADRLRATDAGADGYLIKPFGVRLLLEEVTRLLSR